MSRVRAHQGFTLVELLLGLAIAALLMVPLAAMFQSASGSAVATRAALDLNADARFALDRIARRVAALSPVASGATVTDAGAAAWLGALSYTVVNGNLVESGTATATAPAPGPATAAAGTAPGIASSAGTGVIASNVSAFRLSTPEVGDGQPVLKIDLRLEAGGSSVSASRTVRVGAPF